VSFARSRPLAAGAQYPDRCSAPERRIGDRAVSARAHGNGIMVMSSDLRPPSPWVPWPPSRREVEDKFEALLKGSAKRDEFDRWTAQWVAAVDAGIEDDAKIWAARSRYQWTLDISLLSGRYGIDDADRCGPAGGTRTAWRSPGP
jgi:hypothetical protein